MSFEKLIRKYFFKPWDIIANIFCFCCLFQFNLVLFDLKPVKQDDGAETKRYYQSMGEKLECNIKAVKLMWSEIDKVKK